MFNNFTPAMLDLFASSLWETLIMVGISGLVGGLLGVPLGVFLRLTDDGGVLENGPVPLGRHLLVAVRSLQRDQLQRDIAPGRQVLRLVDGAEMARGDQVANRIVLQRPVEPFDTGHQRFRRGVAPGTGTIRLPAGRVRTASLCTGSA